MKFLLRLLMTLLLLLGLLALGLKLRYGGGSTQFPDRNTAALLPDTALEVVADLPTPPGNIAVAANGRVFVSLHPEARPKLKVVELVQGEMQPFPNREFQGNFRDVLGIRIDRQNRLWTLDTGLHGVKPARLMAFDLTSGLTVQDIQFPRSVAGYGSHFNDFQIAPDGLTAYIADASFFGKRPAIVVVDLKTGSARRLLDGHDSVAAERFIPVVQGRPMEAFSLVVIRPGVDSIALSRDGEWLYFAAVTAQQLYRIRTADLQNQALSATDLQLKVSSVAQKTMSDGISTDAAGNVWITDPEHSSVLRLDPEGRLQTVVQSPRLRWPDGLSFGPDGWLYVTSSALHQVIGLPPSSVAQHAPYQVFRFKPGTSAVAGH